MKKELLFILLLFPVAAFSQFSSSYSYVNDSICRWMDREEGDGYQICDGKDGFEVLINFDVYGSPYASVQKEEQDFYCALTPDTSYERLEYGKAIEWRMKDGKPFAVIFRVKTIEFGEGDEDLPTEITGEYLMVKGLYGSEHINELIDVRSVKDANTAAREAADSKY